MPKKPKTPSELLWRFSLALALIVVSVLVLKTFEYYHLTSGVVGVSLSSFILMATVETASLLIGISSESGARKVLKKLFGLLSDLFGNLRDGMDE